MLHKPLAAEKFQGPDKENFIAPGYNFSITPKSDVQIPQESPIPTKNTGDLLRSDEREYLRFIHSLYSENFREYLIEAQKFRDIHRKNVKCDICGEWKLNLSTHNGQTYCEKHIPVERSIEDKVTPGNHGAAINFIKK